MPSESGWILVETTQSPLAKGYVPAGYLSEPLEEKDRLNISQKSIESPVKSPVTSPQPRIRRLSDPRLGNYLDETQDYLNTRKSRIDTTFRSSPNNVSLPLPLKTSKFGASSLVEFRRGQLQFNEEKVSEEELQRMLQRNDQWHSQVLDARNRKEHQTGQALTVLKQSLAQAREKSQDLSSQLNRIETELEHKRNKWRKKLEEHEKYVSTAKYR